MPLWAPSECHVDSPARAEHCSRILTLTSMDRGKEMLHSIDLCIVRTLIRVVSPPPQGVSRVMTPITPPVHSGLRQPRLMSTPPWTL